MFRLFIFVQIFLLCSCVTSRSLDHFASKRKLTTKAVENISLFNGKVEIEENLKKGLKEPVYLLYDNNVLSFVSNTNRIDNNEFIYTISDRTDSSITLTRGTKFPRYYTVDTLLFGSNFAIEKRCLYDNNQIVQFFFTEYQFLGDSLNISSYQFDRDIISTSLYERDISTISEKAGKPKEIKSYANQTKLTFFKKYIN